MEFYIKHDGHNFFITTSDTDENNDWDFIREQAVAEVLMAIGAIP